MSHMMPSMCPPTQFLSVRTQKPLGAKRFSLRAKGWNVVYPNVLSPSLHFE